METTKIKKTSEELEEAKRKNKEVADTYAQMKGADDINAITDDIRDKLNSKDPTKQKMGRDIALQTISDLAQLILYQELQSMSLPSAYDLVERTNDGYISNGNAKEYSVDYLTGTETFVETNFNPDKQTLKNINYYIIQMYDAGGALNAKAFQILKELTLQQVKWIPYFISGKLNEFMNRLREGVYKTIKVRLSDMLFKLLTSDETYNKKINGTAANMFEAFATEIIPTINDMTLLNSKYNSKASKFIDTTNIDDVIIICSNKVKTALHTGVMTQLYNAKMLKANGKELSYSNLVCLGDKMTITDQDTAITATNQPWCDDNTIFVIDISKIKTIYQVNETASQFYARNLTLYIALHIWGAMDVLPWCKCFKYTNANLTVLPK